MKFKDEKHSLILKHLKLEQQHDILQRQLQYQDEINRVKQSRLTQIYNAEQAKRLKFQQRQKIRQKRLQKHQLYIQQRNQSYKINNKQRKHSIKPSFHQRFQQNLLSRDYFATKHQAKMDKAQDNFNRSMELKKLKLLENAEEQEIMQLEAKNRRQIHQEVNRLENIKKGLILEDRLKRAEYRHLLHTSKMPNKSKFGKQSEILMKNYTPK